MLSSGCAAFFPLGTYEPGVCDSSINPDASTGICYTKATHEFLRVFNLQSDWTCHLGGSEVVSVRHPSTVRHDGQQCEHAASED